MDGRSVRVAVSVCAMTFVTVRDLATGECSSRPRETLTVDVPVDFLRAGGVFAVEDGFRATYTAVERKQVIQNVSPRPLSWRAEGERCLVARSGGTARRLRHYRLCCVERTPDARALPDGLMRPA
jgi:hypothetical protein